MIRMGAAIGHGVAGIEHEIDQGGLEFGPVARHLRQIYGAGFADQAMGRADRAFEQIAGFSQGCGDVETRRRHLVAPREGEHAFDQTRTALGRSVDHAGNAADLVRIVRALGHTRCTTAHRLDDVLEIMGNTADDPSERIDALGMGEPALGLGAAAPASNRASASATRSRRAARWIRAVSTSSAMAAIQAMAACATSSRSHAARIVCRLMP